MYVNTNMYCLKQKDMYITILTKFIL